MFDFQNLATDLDARLTQLELKHSAIATVPPMRKAARFIAAAGLTATAIAILLAAVDPASAGHFTSIAMACGLLAAIGAGIEASQA